MIRKTIKEEDFPKIASSHKNCNCDSETIVWNKKEHIERIIDYDHNIDWFLEIPLSKGIRI
jgi:hypothetical protein